MRCQHGYEGLGDTQGNVSWGLSQKAMNARWQSCNWRTFNSYLLSTYSKPKSLLGPWNYKAVPLWRLLFGGDSQTEPTQLDHKTLADDVRSVPMGQKMGWGELFSPISNSQLRPGAES